MERGSPLEVSFFETEAGNQPVREWLLSLSNEERKQIGSDIRAVQKAWPCGKPLVDSLGHGLWEVRSRLPHRIARVMFIIQEQEIILLHGFIKKDQKTPKTDLDLGLRRKKQYESA